MDVSAAKGTWRDAVESATNRELIVDAWGAVSGARIERLTLADGRTVIAKWMVRNRDWVIARTRDVGRLQSLWASGTLQRTPASIDVGIIAIEETVDGWLVIMRDVGPVLSYDRVLTQVEATTILRAAADLHRAFEGFWLDDLCALEDRYRLMAPPVADIVERISSDPVFEGRDGAEWGMWSSVDRGWALFFELVPRDIADAVQAIHAGDSSFAQALRSRPMTLVHGDIKQPNLSLKEGRVGMLDWGSLTGVAPAAVDVAWFLWGAFAMENSRDELLEIFRSAEGPRFDAIGLDLALLGVVAQLGHYTAFDIVEHRRPAARDEARADLAWWVARARRGLEHWSPSR